MTVLPFPQRPQPPSPERVDDVSAVMELLSDRQGEGDLSTPDGPEWAHSCTREPYASPDALAVLAQAYTDGVRLYEASRTELSEAIDRARRQGATWPEIAGWTGMSEGALRMMRDRWRRRAGSQDGSTSAAQ